MHSTPTPTPTKATPAVSWLPWPGTVSVAGVSLMGRPRTLLVRAGAVLLSEVLHG